MYILLKDSEQIYKGTYNECLFYLQKIQSFSFEWAIKYGGYSIKQSKK